MNEWYPPQNWSLLAFYRLQVKIVWWKVCTQHSAPNWCREDKPGAVSRLAFMGRRGERRPAIFAYFLTTSLQIWGRLSGAHESIWPADWDWDGDGEEKITVNIYLELNLLPSSSILNHSTCWRNGSFQKALCVSCKCPVCSQFIFPIAACQLRCELVVVFCPNSYC